MSERDREYYTSRAEVEREMSETTADPVVAAVHAELAAGYERLTAKRSGKPPALYIVTH